MSLSTFVLVTSSVSLIAIARHYRDVRHASSRRGRVGLNRDFLLLTIAASATGF